jgi:hypothetical protein
MVLKNASAECIIFGSWSSPEQRLRVDYDQRISVVLLHAVDLLMKVNINHDAAYQTPLSLYYNSRK